MKITIKPRINNEFHINNIQHVTLLVQHTQTLGACQKKGPGFFVVGVSCCFYCQSPKKILFLLSHSCKPLILLNLIS